MSTYVMDACALTAYLREEAGADAVERVLLEADAVLLVHAVNLCEVYYDTLRVGGPTAAEKAMTEVAGAGVGLRADMDEAFWRQVGQYKVTPGKMALADCFALSLAVRTGATIVTGDHEFDPVADAGICPILFIR